MGLPSAEEATGTGEFEVGGKGEIGIGVEIDGGFAAGTSAAPSGSPTAQRTIISVGSKMLTMAWPWYNWSPS